MIDQIYIITIGSIKDPLLWIISFTIGSNFFIKNYKLLYLILSGLLWGLIRYYIYKSLGENINIDIFIIIIVSSILIMVSVGLFISTCVKHFKNNKLF